MTCEMSAHSSLQTKLSPRAEGFRRLDEARLALIKLERSIECGLELVVGKDDFMNVDDESRIDEARTLVKIAQNILERYLTDNMFDYEND